MNKTLMAQRKSGNEKEYLVCYTLVQMKWQPEETAVTKMRTWEERYATPNNEDITLTRKWLKKFDITQHTNGSFNIILDNMGTSSKKKTATTADIVIFPSHHTSPILFSIKNNNTFLKSPCPNAFPTQAGLDETDFKDKYNDIMDNWHEELITKYGGRFPIKNDKMKHYILINNLIKSYLITYGANAFINFILDLNSENPDKYIIKYNKKTVNIYKIDIELDQYNIVPGRVKDTFLYINLVHKTKKMEPIEIQLRIKNYEAFVRRTSKVLPIKYTVSLRNIDRFRCLTATLSTNKNPIPA